MISLTSPVRVAAHGWPAALKLGLLSLVTLGLASTAQLWVQCAALLVMLGLYAAPGWLFFTVGLRRLIILWPFVLGVMAWHIYIEDSPGNLESLRKRGHYAICFANSTNRELAAPRARTWDEVYRLVELVIVATLEGSELD